MTAEAVVMNTAAVAMAADSAVTVGRGKVFHGANKLFALSKRHPVGVMVYGSASLLGVPWETLIKLFRAHLGDRSCAHLDDYSNELLSFIADRIDLYPREVQERQVETRLRALYEQQVLAPANMLAVQRQTEIMEREGAIHAAQVDDVYREAACDVIESHAHASAEEPNDVELTDEDLPLISEACRPIAEGLTQEYFGDWGLPAEHHEQLVSICLRAILRRQAPACEPYCSGIIVAGFGEDDVFPRARHHSVWGVFCDVLLSREEGPGPQADIGPQNPSTVIPAAQRDVVDTLIEGVHPDYRRRAGELTTEIVEGTIGLVVDALRDHLGEETANSIREVLDQHAHSQIQSLEDQLSHYRTQQLVAPFLAAVSGLPKGELGEIAENLVSMTAIRRKVSTDEETVGGPIDVAVITKGDGFVWVKRKHYFPGELNPQFFENYNWEAEHGDKEVER